MIISDILQTKGSATIHAIPPDHPLSEAVQEMIALNIGSLLVMESGRLLGIVTQHDVLKALARCRCDLTTIAVKEMMTKKPFVGKPDDSVDYVRGVMTEHHFSHLPVMDGDNLLGLISFHDIAKAALKAAAFENMLLKRYIKHWPEEEQA